MLLTEHHSRTLRITRGMEVSYINWYNFGHHPMALSCQRLCSYLTVGRMLGISRCLYSYHTFPMVDRLLTNN